MSGSTNPVLHCFSPQRWSNGDFWSSSVDREITGSHEKSSISYGSHTDKVWSIFWDKVNQVNQVNQGIKKVIWSLVSFCSLIILSSQYEKNKKRPHAIGPQICGTNPKLKWWFLWVFGVEGRDYTVFYIIYIPWEVLAWRYNGHRMEIEWGYNEDTMGIQWKIQA